MRHRKKEKKTHRREADDLGVYFVYLKYEKCVKRDLEKRPKDVQRDPLNRLTKEID